MCHMYRLKNIFKNFVECGNWQFRWWINKITSISHFGLIPHLVKQSFKFSNLLYFKKNYSDRTNFNFFKSLETWYPLIKIVLPLSTNGIYINFYLISIENSWTLVVLLGMRLSQNFTIIKKRIILVERNNFLLLLIQKLQCISTSILWTYLLHLVSS